MISFAGPYPISFGYQSKRAALGVPESHRYGYVPDKEPVSFSGIYHVWSLLSLVFPLKGRVNAKTTWQNRRDRVWKQKVLQRDWAICEWLFEYRGNIFEQAHKTDLQTYDRPYWRCFEVLWINRENFLSVASKSASHMAQVPASYQVFLWRCIMIAAWNTMSL